MKTLLAAASLLLVGAPSAAFAAAATPTPHPAATPAPVATPAPMPAATPEPPAAPEVAAAPVARFEAGPGDPNEKKFGVGFGWTFPADLTVPNTVSVRFRMKSGTTIEPIANASFAQTFDHQHLASSSNPSAASRAYTTNLGFALQMRKPMKRSGPVEMHCILTPGVSVTDSVNNPAGAKDRQYDTTTTWGLGWGLGVEYYPTKLEQHWSLSLDALNPLFAFNFETQYDQATRIRENSTTYALGATFNPTVRGMAHLYF